MKAYFLHHHAGKQATVFTKNTQNTGFLTYSWPVDKGWGIDQGDGSTCSVSGVTWLPHETVSPLQAWLLRLVT